MVEAIPEQRLGLRRRVSESCIQECIVEAPPSQHAATTSILAERIRDLEAARIEALVTPDVERLRQIHCDDYQLITPSGRAFSREEYLGLIESGHLRYLRWEAGPMQVRTSATMAIVRYRVTLQLGSADAPGRPLPCWHTDSYEMRDGIWQAVWSQATEVRP